MSTPRPSTVLAALLASTAALPGCWYACEDNRFEEVSLHLQVEANDEGLVEAAPDGDTLDPWDADDCAALCQQLYAGVDTVHTCTAAWDESNPGGGDDSGLPGGGLVALTCVASGVDVCVGGRHSAALATRAQGEGVDFVAAWLAREASGELGSVVAFQRLADELVAHGAPEALVRQARAAEADEIRHARMVRALAQSRGGVPAPVEAVALPPRSLFEVALENAVEGCVHETFAAARAGWQALHATDEAVASVSAVLAEDEARHADLAAAVHAWACSVLPSEQAEALERARQAAWSQLENSPPAVSRPAQAVLGLPSPVNHRRLARAVASLLAA